MILANVTMVDFGFRVLPEWRNTSSPFLSAAPFGPGSSFGSTKRSRRPGWLRWCSHKRASVTCNLGISWAATMWRQGPDHRSPTQDEVNICLSNSLLGWHVKTQVKKNVLITHTHNPQIDTLVCILCSNGWSSMLTTSEIAVLHTVCAWTSESLAYNPCESQM